MSVHKICRRGCTFYFIHFVFSMAGLGLGGGMVGVYLMSREVLLFRFNNHCKINVYYGICMYMYIGDY